MYLLSLLILLFHVVVLPFAVLHALLNKRDHRAALGWIGIIIVFPVAGSLLYFLFGINRIRARARLLAGGTVSLLDLGLQRSVWIPDRTFVESNTDDPLSRVGRRVTGAERISGNSIQIMKNGEEFFPVLLQTIDDASSTVVLSSYLFSTKGVAAEVIDSLVRACARGVKVYVLIDGIGAWYSLRSAVRRLQDTPVHVATFFPPRLIPPSLGINVRNHRKIIVIDGVTGFFGGINIDRRHMLDDAENAHPTEDVHFRMRGPAVKPLQEIFVRDWWMATRQQLEFPGQEPVAEGTVTCRVIDDGPDESLDYLGMTLMGVFGAAKHSILIMVPYFLPSREMSAVLQAASLRGVRVQIVLPVRSNLPFIDWATRSMLWELVMWHVEVYVRGPPFAHTKLIVVDDEYVLGGSANLDLRSLRLNFELGVEMFAADVNRKIRKHIEDSIAGGHRVTLQELNARPLWQRIRDAFFWLFSGYL